MTGPTLHTAEVLEHRLAIWASLGRMEQTLAEHGERLTAIHRGLTELQRSPPATV